MTNTPTDDSTPQDLIREARLLTQDYGEACDLATHVWMAKLDSLADALETQVSMWRTLEDHFEIVKDMQPSVVYSLGAVNQLNYAHAGLQAMHAIEAQFKKETTDG